MMKSNFTVFSLALFSVAIAATPTPQEALQRVVAPTGISGAPPIDTPTLATWFGVKADGTTSDAAALQAAIDFLAGTGGTLIV